MAKIIEVAIVAPVSHLWIHPTYYYLTEEDATKAIFNFLDKNKFMNKNYKKVTSYSEKYEMTSYKYEKIDEKELPFTLEECSNFVKKRNEKDSSTLDVMIDNLVRSNHSVTPEGEVLTTKYNVPGPHVLAICIRNIELNKEIKETRDKIVNT